MLRSDGLIPLNGGAYQARDPIAGAQICENLFPETNPQTADPTAAVTNYPREGKRPLSAPPNPDIGRGIFTMSNGALFGVVGSFVYSIDTAWNWNVLGQIGNATTPVSMSDNGVNAVLVDGSVVGYQIVLGTSAFSTIVDATGSFQGSRRVDFSDTYLAFATPGTNEWLVTLSDQVAFNALVNAAKDSSPDPIETLAFNLRQAWLLGTQRSEIWFLAGSTPFPYNEWPNVFIPYGCAAVYSLTQADYNLFWLSRNPNGQAIALKTKGNAVEAVSTRALEYEWSNYARIDDCITGSFQQAGHTFVVFHFPSADRSWAYDLATQQWHRRTYLDAQGGSHREKTAFYAAVGADGGYAPTVVGQDWQTGQIYALDPKFYTDNGQPIICRRSFPHVMENMKEITHVAFVADFSTGNIIGVGDNPPGSPWSTGFSSGFGPNFATPSSGPQLFMRYSNDGGNTWTNYRGKKRMNSGNYRSMMRWRGLGMARDRIYELLWSYNAESALQGAFVDPLVHGA